MLLRLGCNPNIQDQDGNSPVHFACLHGHGAVLEKFMGQYTVTFSMSDDIIII